MISKLRVVFILKRDVIFKMRGRKRKYIYVFLSFFQINSLILFIIFFFFLCFVVVFVQVSLTPTQHEQWKSHLPSHPPFDLRNLTSLFFLILPKRDPVTNNEIIIYINIYKYLSCYSFPLSKEDIYLLFNLMLFICF